MLQEIINKLTEPTRTAYRKIQDLLYEATMGLVRDYQRKTLELARLTAASYYLQTMQWSRKAAAALFVVTVASVVFAVAVVMVPIALVMVSPWTVPQKLAAISALGLADIAITVWYLAHLFSEERWLKITKTREFIDKIKNL